MKYRPVRLILRIFILLIYPAICTAQIDRSSLNGTVRDSEGMRVSGAAIRAVQTSTGLIREAVSSSSGSYAIPELPIGSYRVTCLAPGFQQAVFDSIVQTAGLTRSLDFTLAVDTVTQAMNVSGLTAQLDVTTAALSARIELVQVKDLPLNGRNWSTLTALVPGAVDTGGSNQRSVRFAGRRSHQP
jgi:hypothetical protein